LTVNSIHAASVFSQHLWLFLLRSSGYLCLSLSLLNQMWRYSDLNIVPSLKMGSGRKIVSRGRWDNGDTSLLVSLLHFSQGTNLPTQAFQTQKSTDLASISHGNTSEIHQRSVLKGQKRPTWVGHRNQQWSSSLGPRKATFIATSSFALCLSPCFI
jgi:hypothetical protein